MNMFAVITNSTGSNQIKRISLSQDIQSSLEKYYDSAKKDFLEINTEPKEKIEFNGDYKCEDNEIFFIRDFKWGDSLKIKHKLEENLPDFNNPLGFSNIQKEEIEKIKIIIINLDDFLLFQSIDARKLIKPKSFLIFSEDTFNYEENTGIKLDKNVDAMIIKSTKDLFFTSFHNASKIFDLTDVYREATDEEINEFKQHEIFEGDIPAHINSKIRKKIFLIIKNDTLSKVKDNFKRVKQYAMKELELNCFDNDKIKLPSKKDEFYKLVNFLNEDLYRSPISNLIYESNSKKPSE